MSSGHQKAELLDPPSAIAPDAADQWTFSRLAAPANAADWLSEGSLFALTDGVVGVRGGIEELQPSGGGVFLNRVYDRTPIVYHERFSGFPTFSDTRLPVADGSIVELWLGDANVSAGQIIDFHRHLNLRTGELVRTTQWRAPNGASIRVLARRVVFGGGVFALRLEVQSIDFTGPVSFVSRLKPGGAGVGQSDDPRQGVGNGDELETSGLCVDVGNASLLQHGCKAGVGAAIAQAHRAEQLELTEFRGGDDGATTVFSGELVPGARATLEKTIVYVPFEVGEEEHALESARARAGTHARAAYAAAALAAAQELARFWNNADVELLGNPGLTGAMRFNLMHLRRSAPADGQSGLAAKGLTGEGYQGHAFWDTEAFAVPVLALTAPEIARSNLAFRASTLDRARDHARLMNHASGALYPWRTIAGDEGSGFFPAGSAQYHINAAIAYAVRFYDRATGDDAFVLGDAAPMVFETARLWLDVGFHDANRGGAFRICAVTGPDEYSAIVDDDHYTNRMARLHLQYALELAERAPDAPCAPNPEERERWRAAAEKMYLPVDPELGIHPQDATFLGKPEWQFRDDRHDRPLLLHYHPLTLYRHQVIKQASVVLAHAMAEGSTRAQQRRDFDYYEPRTAHDSSLSAASHAIVGANIGRTAKAFEFLRESVLVDLDNLHGNVGHGLHMASMAGGWQALVWGFAGMRVIDRTLAFYPRSTAELPAYVFSLKWRGAKLRVAVDGSTTRYALDVAGEPLILCHDGVPLSLQPGETAERQTPHFGETANGAFRALVFDLDGVLTDTAHAHYVAWKALADDLAIPFDEAANEELKGIDRDRSLELILSRGPQAFGAAQRRAMADRKNVHYRQLIANFTSADLLPGAREALQRARAAGLRMAIASASRNASVLLERLGIAHFFDAVVDPAMIARGKPDPAIFLEAARELGVAPRHCLGIEDSRAGVAAIKAAGMSALGVGDAAVLGQADAVVDDLSAVDWSAPLAAASDQH